MGAGLFIANRVKMGIFLVLVGTGQGLFTIALRIMTEIWFGRLLLLENNKTENIYLFSYVDLLRRTKNFVMIIIH